MQELELGACHHGKAEPPHHCLIEQGLSATSTSCCLASTLEAISATTFEVSSSSPYCRRSAGLCQLQSDEDDHDDDTDDTDDYDDGNDDEWWMMTT